MLNIPMLRDMLDQMEHEVQRKGLDVRSVPVKFLDDEGNLYELNGVDFDEEPTHGAPFVVIEGEFDE